MLTTRLLFAALTIAFSGCGPENKNAASQPSAAVQTGSGKMKAIIENAIELDSVPSGSGLVKAGENFYLVSDDSPYYFKLDARFQVLEKTAIPRHQQSRDYRIPKATKPDYESACLGKMDGETYLLAFASGSQSPARDSLLVVNLTDAKDARTYSLRPFYDLIKTAAGLTEADINVEGSAIIGEELFLFNRGKNVVVQTNWPKTLAFLTQKVAAPEIKTYRLKLSQIKGIDPGFSGACQLGNENRILFTASVENTQNWVADGEILGSFVGIINVEKLSSQPLEKVALLTSKTGAAVIEKVESIEFLSRQPNGVLKVLCLTDDDLGGSKILEVTLQEF